MTDIEKKFLKAFKKDRNKKNFKNPSVIRSQLKDKSKKILLAIPELVEDIDLLYKFGIEEENIEFYNLWTYREIDSAWIFNIVLGSFDSFSTESMKELENTLNSMDVKQLLFLAVSILFLGRVEEYKDISRKTYFNIKEYEKWVKSYNPRNVSLFDNIYSSLADREFLLEVLHNLSANHGDLLAKDVLPAVPQIMETLKSLPHNEKIVALEVLKSNSISGISRNVIVKNTGFDKRFVARYTNNLIEKNIIKSENRIGIDYFYWVGNKGLIQTI